MKYVKKTLRQVPLFKICFLYYNRKEHVQNVGEEYGLEVKMIVLVKIQFISKKDLRISGVSYIL